MLRQLDENLWIINHAFKMAGGVQIGTRTTLIRLSDGSIFAHAPGPADDGDHIEISKYGKVSQIVAPNLFHNEFVEDWIDISHLLIWHGRKVCIARRPRCDTCLLADICPGKV